MYRNITRGILVLLFAMGEVASADAFSLKIGETSPDGKFTCVSVDVCTIYTDSLASYVILNGKTLSKFNEGWGVAGRQRKAIDYVMQMVDKKLCKFDIEKSTLDSTSVW